MAVYDTSVLLRCIRESDEEACNVIFSDPNCVIPPTTYEELTYKKRPQYSDRYNLTEQHCRVYTNDEPPFDNPEIQAHIAAFVTETRVKWARGQKKRGRGAKSFNRLLSQFQRFCVTNGDVQTHFYNDYQIYKEANILAEQGLVDPYLVSADRAQTLDICQEVFKDVMENELPSGLREKKIVQGVFYKNFNPPSTSL